MVYGDDRFYLCVEVLRILCDSFYGRHCQCFAISLRKRKAWRCKITSLVLKLLYLWLRQLHFLFFWWSLFIHLKFSVRYLLCLVIIQTPMCIFCRISSTTNYYNLNYPRLSAASIVLSLFINYSAVYFLLLWKETQLFLRGLLWKIHGYENTKIYFAGCVTVLFLFPVIYMLACSFMTGSQVSEMLNFSDGKYKELNMIPNMATFGAVLSDSFQKTRIFVEVLEFGYLYFSDSNRSGCSIIIGGFCFCKIEIPVQGPSCFSYT